MFETIILNMIYLIFPLTLYIIYCMYASTLNKNTNDFIMTFFLVTAFYFLIRFGSNEITNLPLLLILVPLYIAYINKSDIGILILSMLVLIYYFKFNLGFLVIIPLLVDYIVYKFLYVKMCNLKLFLLISILLGLTPLIFNINDISLDIVIYLVFSLILPFLIVISIKDLEQVANLHMNLQKIEHEKEVQLSIFKITHEIKNPIAVCKGYLDMFDVSNIEHSKKYIPIIKSEIERTLCLLQNFLDFNKIKLDKEEMDLVLLLDDIKSSCMPLLSNNKITLDCNINSNDEEVYINGDFNRLKQVLINVIKNSIEALDNRTNPQIKFFYKIKKDYVHIYVEDNGCGMSREALARVKEPFFTTKNNGTGLGITISHEVIQGHKGIIKYTSKENVGTKVEIILPLENEK